MSGRVDIDFIAEGTTQEDVNLFLGPVNEEQKQVFFDPNNTLMAHLLFEAGIFPSVSQARKNGFNKPVPTGFTQLVKGKNRALLTVLNPSD